MLERLNQPSAQCLSHKLAERITCADARRVPDSPPKAITRSITRTVLDPPWVTRQTRLSLLWTSRCQRVSLKTRRDPRPAVRLGRLVGSDDDCGPTRTPPSQPISALRAPGLPASAAPHRTLDASGSANRARGRRDACLTLFPVAHCALWINGLRPSSPAGFWLDEHAQLASPGVPVTGAHGWSCETFQCWWAQ